MPGAGWYTLKNVTVPSSVYPVTGPAGAYLKSDLVTLVNAAPYLTSGTPVVSSDSTKGFSPGSQWLDISTGNMWICVSPTAGSAVWRSLYRRTAAGIILCPGESSGNRTIQTDTGGNTRGSDAVDFQVSRSVATQVASGVSSFIAGGQANTASGSSSHAEGNLSLASGATSHAEGYGGQATGNFSHAEGLLSTASGQSSHSEGSSSISSGANSHSEGQGTTASGTYSHSGGKASKARLSARWARAAGGHVGQIGTAQTAISQLMRATTDATQAELTLGGDTPSASNRFLLADGQTLGCFVIVVGKKESGGANDHAMFIRQVLIRRAGSTTALVGSLQTIGTDINPAAWGGVSIAADSTNQSMQVLVTGLAATNIRWTATVISTESSDAAI